MALPVLETREPLKFIGTKIYSQHKTYSSKVELRLQQYDGVVQYESNVLTYLHIWTQLNDSPIWYWRFFYMG